MCTLGFPTTSKTYMPYGGPFAAGANCSFTSAFSARRPVTHTSALKGQITISRPAFTAAPATIPKIATPITRMNAATMITHRVIRSRRAGGIPRIVSSVELRSRDGFTPPDCASYEEALTEPTAPEAMVEHSHFVLACYGSCASPPDCQTLPVQ